MLIVCNLCSVAKIVFIGRWTGNNSTKLKIALKGYDYQIDEILFPLWENVSFLFLLFLWQPWYIKCYNFRAWRSTAIEIVYVASSFWKITGQLYVSGWREITCSHSRWNCWPYKRRYENCYSCLLLFPWCNSNVTAWPNIMCIGIIKVRRINRVVIINRVISCVQNTTALMNWNIYLKQM
jgi:hypothetical protein